MTHPERVRSWPLLGAALLVTAPMARAERFEIVDFTAAQDLVSVARHGDTLWFGSGGGGVVEFSTLDATFNVYTPARHALPDVFIRAIAVDNDGNVWAATDFGLAVKAAGTPFDAPWTVFGDGDDPLTDSNIFDVAADPAGGVWVATFDEGLFHFANETWTNFNTSNSPLADRFVTSLTVADDGALWMGLFGDFVQRFDGVSWTQFTAASTGTPPGLCFPSNDPEELGLISSVVQVISQTGDGSIWFNNIDDGFCDLNGVSRFDGADWDTFFRRNSSLPQSNILDAGTTPAGDVWLLTFSGIVRFDPDAGGAPEEIALRGAGDFVPAAIDASAFNMTTIGDTIWLGTFAGVGSYDGLTTELFPVPGLIDGLIHDIAVRDLGRKGFEMWVGNRLGLQFYDGRDWTTFTPETSPLAFNDVGAIAIDRRGDVWIGGRIGGNGVQVVGGDKWTRFVPGPDTGLINGAISDIAIDPRTDEKWFGDRFSPGLSAFDGSSWTTYTPANSPIPSSPVRDIEIDSQSVKWIATAQGIARFDGTDWQTFGTAHGLPGTFVDDLAIGPDGRVWAATTRGLAFYDGAAWQTIPESAGRDIRMVTVDDEGLVWAGVRNSGVALWDGTRWLVFDKSDGLLNDRAETGEIAPDGRVWVGTERGIIVIDGPIPEPRCAGDADGSGFVDHADILAVIDNFGATYDTTGPGDADLDGDVDVHDFHTVLVNFRRSCNDETNDGRTPVALPGAPGGVPIFGR